MAMAVGVAELRDQVARAVIHATTRRLCCPASPPIFSLSVVSRIPAHPGPAARWCSSSTCQTTPARRRRRRRFSPSAEATTAGVHAQGAAVDGLGDRKCVLRDLSYGEVASWVESIGFREGHAAMLWRWLYGAGKWATTFDEMADLGKEFRAALGAKAEVGALQVERVHTAGDGTRKIVFAVQGGGTVETVVIPCASGRRGRTTVCVSSQVGCAMNCQFCFTGRMGLTRNLTMAEIVGQLVGACRLCAADVGPVTNVVFMGMGEPLHNADNVIRAANIMVHERGFHLSHNKVTVSTSGLVPPIRRFFRETPCSLAVSLNATTDEVRDWIMPVNRKYGLKALMGALKEGLAEAPGRQVFFEYVMLAGVNDSAEDARRVVELVDGIRCKINLICFNAHSQSGFQSSPHEQMLLFRDIIAGAGLTVYIRQSRGDDQMAACGQLGTLGTQLAPRMAVPEKFQAALVA